MPAILNTAFSRSGENVNVVERLVKMTTIAGKLPFDDVPLSGIRGSPFAVEPNGVFWVSGRGFVPAHLAGFAFSIVLLPG